MGILSVVVRPAAEHALVEIVAPAGVAPGQACVFYDGERVLGGGWIQRQDARLAA